MKEHFRNVLREALNEGRNITISCNGFEGLLNEELSWEFISQYLLKFGLENGFITLEEYINKRINE